MAYKLQNNSLQYGRRAKTDSSGNYRIAVEPGTVMIEPDSPPKTHMGMARENCPQLEVKADRTWPDLKLAPAVTIEGVVVDACWQTRFRGRSPPCGARTSGRSGAICLP